MDFPEREMKLPRIGALIFDSMDCHIGWPLVSETREILPFRGWHRYWIPI